MVSVIRVLEINIKLKCLIWTLQQTMLTGKPEKKEENWYARRSKEPAAYSQT